jgi:tetratricopeptide (TPR) repeat protein
MKRVLGYLLLFAVLGNPSLYAQKAVWGKNATDSTVCFEKYNTFGALYNSKSYVEAYEPWKAVYETCPQATEVIYKFAPKILEAKIKEATDPKVKNDLVRLLMSTYDRRNELYPGKEAEILAQKADDFWTYYPDSASKAYDMYKKVFAMDPKALQPAYLNNYFNVVIKLYKDEKLNSFGLVEGFNDVAEAIELQSNDRNTLIAQLTEKDTLGTISDREKRNLDANRKLLAQSEKLLGNIEKGIAPLLTCERLTLIYNDSTYALHTTDKSWLVRALKMLSKERTAADGSSSDCTDNPMYFKAASALYKLDPSAQAARSMGLLSVKNGMFSEAKKYFDDAIRQEVDPKKRAKDWLKLAVVAEKQGQLAEAKRACLESARANPESGEAYLFLASVYGKAAGTCGSNAFEKNAVYWAAINMANRAASVQPDLAGRAESLASAFRKNVPDKSIAFQFNYKEGDTYTIGCWINERVVVRF